MTTLDTADKLKEIRVTLMCASAVHMIRPNSESAKFDGRFFAEIVKKIFSPESIAGGV